VTTIPAEARTHIDDLAAFVQASPSSYHAAGEARRRLVENGFTALAEADAWDLAPGGRYVVVREGSVIAFVLPETVTATTPFQIVGAHTDSPSFKLKPKPTTVGVGGWWQLGWEVYGGPLLNSWLDRELILAGRIVTLNGEEHLVRTAPIARIPQLAIHLDRGVNNDGLSLDKQRQTAPVWGLGDAESADILALLAAGAGVDADEIGGFDIVAADSQEPRVFGAHEEFFASGRMDNLLSTHAALVAIQAAQPETAIAMFAAFDHEEIGSSTRSGAAGPFHEEVLTRILAAFGAGPDERARAFAQSLHVSSDVGHSVHPNYPERHDGVNQPVAGDGPILKINASQRYATDAHGAAAWNAACRRAGVPSQEFVSNNTMPCGSTIGPISATRLGIRTVDAAHATRANALTAEHRARRQRGEKHPVWDFLFTYYSVKPSLMARWHPGAGVVLEDAVSEPRARFRWYAPGPVEGSLVVDGTAFDREMPALSRLIEIMLRRTAERAGQFDCFGLHEWAMVYRQDEHRHPQPLRLGQAATDEVVESHDLRCTHFDAFRFYTPAAVPRNRTRLTREDQPEREQPGCLHAGMDVYKWAIKLGPLVPSELMLDAFELARDIRLLDMEAAPYDLSAFGVAPVRIETTEGKAEYVSRQRAFAERGNSLRRGILDAWRGSVPGVGLSETSADV
jgi:aspartyl aminopeptidase